MAGGNAVVVRSTSAPTAINGQGLIGGQSDIVTVGDSQNVQGINGQLTITNTGYSTLTIDDSANGTPRSATFDTGAPDDFYNLYPYGVISGLAPAPIRFRAADVSSPVTVKGGSGGNTITVENTPVTTVNGQFGPVINLFTGTGSDTVNIHGTGKGTTLNIEGQSGLDTVTIGKNHNTQSVLGTVSLSNNASYDQLTIDDSADTTPRTITLDAIAPAQGQNNPRGAITGIVPGEIDYDAYDMKDPIAIKAGSGGNTVTVNNTPTKLVGLQSGNTINLNTGAGLDTVTIKAVGPGTTLNVDGEDSPDLVTVGNNGSVQSVFGTVTLSNAHDWDTPTIDDSADPTARIVTLSVLPFGGTPVGSVTGLAPGAINFLGSDVKNPTIKAGGGGNVFTVLNTPTTGPNTNVGPQVWLYTGAGNDTINVQGMGPGTTLDVNGQDGSDNLTMDYSTGKIPFLHTLYFDGNLPGPNQNSLTVKGASALDNFNVSQGLVERGIGSDVFGNTYNVYFNTGTFNVNQDLNLLGLVAQGPATTVNFNTAQTISNLYVNGALAEVATGNGTHTLSLKKLTIDSNGSLDLADNSMLISYANNPDPVSSIRGYLASGYNGGNWNGAGLNSSAAANDPLHLTALGYADSADGTGANPTPSSVLVKYTLAGDANLDGKVTLSDFNTVSSNFGLPSGASWSMGDLTYDGKVTLADFNAVSSTFGQIMSALNPQPAMQSFVQPQSQSSVITSADDLNKSPRTTHHRNWNH